MKLSQKTSAVFSTFFFIGGVIGTLGWDILEKVLENAGIKLALSIGPLGFDLSVISFYIKLNPGTLIGFLIGYIIFKRL